MVDLTADAMAQAAVPTRFGKLPASDTELNGDYLQTLTRRHDDGDKRFLEWARRIGDAYIEEVLPGNFGVPGMQWDFTAHTGDRRLRLRDHGNETVVGLTLLFALEHQLGSDRAPRYRAAVQRMLDRILQSAGPDGMLYNEVDAETLAPTDKRLSDNWGYVYGAVYTYYQVTGDTKYRDAVRRVLASLPAYRNHAWEPGRNPPLGWYARPVAESLEVARPVFEEIGRALAGRPVVLVPGNHDHAFAEPWLAGLRLDAQALSTEAEWPVGPDDGAAGRIAGWMPDVELSLAYPGLITATCTPPTGTISTFI